MKKLQKEKPSKNSKCLFVIDTGMGKEYAIGKLNYIDDIKTRISFSTGGSCPYLVSQISWIYLKDIFPKKKNKLTKMEEFAIQQFTGFHDAPDGIIALCCSMGLEKKEWDHIKEDCKCFLTENNLKDIEEYFKLNKRGGKE